MTRRLLSVTLGDATVTEEDVQLLQRPNWLNDQLISLWCEHVRPKGSEKLLILPPNITYFLKLCDDPADVVGALKLQERDVIVAVVNNTSSDGGTFVCPQGTHWSVLAYARSSQIFIALDSSEGMNNSASHQLAKKLTSPLGVKEVVLKAASSAKQPNSYACGDYTCAFIAKIVDDYIKHNTIPKQESSYSSKQVHERAAGMRGELIALIELLTAGRT